MWHCTFATTGPSVASRCPYCSRPAGASSRCCIRIVCVSIAQNILQLKGILQHHVTTSALDLTDFINGQMLSMVDGNSATITMKDGATFTDGVKVIGSVRAFMAGCT